MIHWFRSNKNYPGYYKEYLERIKDEGFSPNIISMDMETSGLNPKTADILSFGSVQLNEGKIIPKSELHLFFNGSTLSDESIVIHELFANTSNEIVADSLPMILSHISNHSILGHFVEFDIALINQQLKKQKLPKLKNPKLDTLQIAMKKDGVYDYRYASRDDYTLYALCDRYAIEVEYTHDALADAYLTALLYLHLT